MKAAADAPPAVSVAEYTRRLLSWKVGYALPPVSERKQLNIRLTGEPKKRTGRKPKYVVPQGHVSDSSVREIVQREALDLDRFEDDGGR